MDIEPTKVEGLRNAVKEIYPDWPNVADPHLQEAITRARELLSEAELRRLLNAGQYDEIINRLRQVAQTGKVLFLNGPQQGDLDILQQRTLDRPSFCQALVDLLHGPGPSPERLGRYIGYVRGHTLPNRWPFPTYFLFVCHPDTEMVVRPLNFFRWLIVKHLGIEKWKWKWFPDPSTYATILEVAQALKVALQADGLRDMAGVYTSIRVAAQVAAAKALSDKMELLSQMCANPEEAEWAFGLFAETLTRLGVTTPDDPRFAVITWAEIELQLYWGLRKLGDWDFWGRPFFILAGQAHTLKVVAGYLFWEGWQAPQAPEGAPGGRLRYRTPGPLRKTRGSAMSRT